MLELVDIHTYYGASYVLRGITLAVQQGSVVALLGRMAWERRRPFAPLPVSVLPKRHGTVQARGNYSSQAL